MIDHEIICIWNDSLQESRDEFIKEFVDLTSFQDREGLYTFVFSRYFEYRVITEVLYSVVYKNTAIFLWPTSNSFVVDVDEKLNVLGGDYLTFKQDVYTEIGKSPNIDYLSTIVSPMGNVFEAFTLKEPLANKYGKEIFENVFKQGYFNLDSIYITDDYMVELSLNYLEERILKFHDQVDKAIDTDDENAQLSENPYANRYYDRGETDNMAEFKRALTDQDV